METMNPRNIALIAGSVRKDSINRKLAHALTKLAPTTLDIRFLRIDDLPVFNQDHEQTPTEAVVRLKSQIAAADGLLFVTPEHNRSIPSALKNALDWGSRPYGKNSWANKPAGIIGASPGSIGTAVAQQHLRNVLAYLDVPTLGQPEAFIHFTAGLINDDGNISNDGTRAFLQGFVDRYAAWVEALTHRMGHHESDQPGRGRRGP
jgi:chromate reductase